MNVGAWATRLLSGRRPLFRTGCFAFFVTPLGVHIFAVITVSQAVLRKIIPEKTCRGIVDVGLIMFQRIFVRNLPLKIVSALFSAIGDLPRFLVVVAGDRRRRPEMHVAGDFSAVV